jgi:hypothetical protein
MFVGILDLSVKTEKGKIFIEQASLTDPSELNRIELTQEHYRHLIAWLHEAAAELRADRRWDNT